MAVRTISKNGKRVPASGDKKAKAKRERPNFPPNLNMNGQHEKKPRKPRPESAGVVKPEKGGKETPGKRPPIWENLKKPWSLTTCHRLVSIAVEHNNALSKRAALSEQKKHIDNERKKADLTTADDKALCFKLVHVMDEIKATKQREKSATADMVRIAIESVGGTVFEAGESLDQDEDDDADEALFPKGSEHVDTHKGVWGKAEPIEDKAERSARETVAELKGDDADEDFEYVHKPIEHLRTAEKHGVQIVSDAAIAALKRAGLEIIRDINNLDLPGLSKTDTAAIGDALEMFAASERMAAV